eukprot:435833_1
MNVQSLVTSILFYLCVADGSDLSFALKTATPRDLTFTVKLHWEYESLQCDITPAIINEWSACNYSNYTYQVESFVDYSLDVYRWDGHATAFSDIVVMKGAATFTWDTFCVPDTLHPCFTIPAYTSQGKCTQYPDTDRWDIMCRGAHSTCDFHTIPHLTLNLSKNDEALLNTNTNPLSQGPCFAGYLDATRDNYEEWKCGMDCIGGSIPDMMATTKQSGGFTYGDCTCACIPDVTCAPTTAAPTRIPTTATAHPTAKPTTPYPTIFAQRVPSNHGSLNEGAVTQARELLSTDARVEKESQELESDIMDNELFVPLVIIVAVFVVSSTVLCLCCAHQRRQKRRIQQSNADMIAPGVQLAGDQVIQAQVVGVDEEAPGVYDEAPGVQLAGDQVIQAQVVGVDEEAPGVYDEAPGVQLAGDQVIQAQAVGVDDEARADDEDSESEHDSIYEKVIERGSVGTETALPPSPPKTQATLTGTATPDYRDC